VISGSWTARHRFDHFAPDSRLRVLSGLRHGIASTLCRLHGEREDVAVPQNEGNNPSMAEDMTRVMERTEAISAIHENLASYPQPLGNVNMDPLAKIARTLQKLETRKIIEEQQEKCRRLLKSRSGVLLTEEWTRQFFLDGEVEDSESAYVVSSTGISESFRSKEHAIEFFQTTARDRGRARRLEWWREWWLTIFLAAIILALVQWLVGQLPELFTTTTEKRP